MNPIYRFSLTIVNSDETTATKFVYPNYADSLALNFEKQSNEEYFRRKLSAALTFYSADYDWIMANSLNINTRYVLDMDISNNGGKTWTAYWKGDFWKTDCEFNSDDKTIRVNPQVNDAYSVILKGIEKEFDLVKLAPEIRPIKAWRRPVVQVYMAGRTTIGCFLAGMYWEQDCESEDNHNRLENVFHFKRNVNVRTITAAITLVGSTTVIGYNYYYGLAPATENTSTTYDGGYLTDSKLVFTYWTTGGQQTPIVYHFKYEIISNGIVYYRYESSNNTGTTPLPNNLVLEGVEQSVINQEATLTYNDTGIYMRCLCDVDEVDEEATYPIPNTDITPDNRNYSRVIGMRYPEAIVISPKISADVSRWGLFQPNLYYQYPAGYLESAGLLEPVAKNTWGTVSVWFSPTLQLYGFEELARKEFTIKGAYSLSSVISKLLGAIDPDGTVTHTAPNDSALFYTSNPITGILSEPCIVPKSNVLYSNNDQPAQKGTITLRSLFDMLRDVYRAYWYIENGHLKIEHIKFFNNGGSYSSVPGVGVDLTALFQPRNGKSLAFALDSWSYDKPETVGQYVFGWMDDASLPFRGYPITILNKFVDEERVENINISDFSSDIDYTLVSPNEVSKDGWMLLQPIYTNSEYQLPIISILDGAKEYIAQNGYCSFLYCRRYYNWDLPAPTYRFGNTIYTAEGTKKLRRQAVQFVSLGEINLQKLITTNIGNGKIDKITLSLLSRNAQIELLYDTE